MLMPNGSVIVADRGYQDFKMMHQWKEEGIIFVTRLKKSIKFGQVKELPLPEGKDEHILKDEIIKLTEEDSAESFLWRQDLFTDLVYVCLFSVGHYPNRY